MQDDQKGKKSDAKDGAGQTERETSQDKQVRDALWKLGAYTIALAGIATVSPAGHHNDDLPELGKVRWPATAEQAAPTTTSNSSGTLAQMQGLTYFSSDNTLVVPHDLLFGDRFMPGPFAYHTAPLKLLPSLPVDEWNVTQPPDGLRFAATPSSTAALPISTPNGTGTFAWIPVYRST